MINGDIEWPEDRTDVNNFFLYLKGEDGKDGADGVDGTNGKSAYELWLEEVEKGLENPHNPGHDWPKDQTELNDFWYYLSGADGKDGVTPNIGDNGNWWINGEDTGIPAKGKTDRMDKMARMVKMDKTDKTAPRLSSETMATGGSMAKTPEYPHVAKTDRTDKTDKTARTVKMAPHPSSATMATGG